MTSWGRGAHKGRWWGWLYVRKSWAVILSRENRRAREDRIRGHRCWWRSKCGDEINNLAG